MLATELALQSFRDVRASAPLQLRPGHNAVVCDSVRPESLCEAYLELLFPGSSPSEGGRGILTFTARDGQSYRVLRDFASGMAQLQAFNQASKQYAMVSEGLANVAKAVRQHVGPAARDAVLQTFIVQGSDIPGAASAETDNPAARSRLRELEAKLASYQRATHIDNELQELTRRKYAADDAVKRLGGDKSHVDAALAELSRFAELSVLSDGFVNEYSDMQAKESQKNADLQRVENERLELERLLRAASETPVFKDWRVIGGLLLGIAAVATGLTLGGSLRLLAFLDIPAFGLATWALWQNLGHREEIGGAKKRIAALDNKKNQISVRDNDMIERVRDLAQLSGLNSLTEVREVITARTAAKKALADAQEAYANAESSPELQKARTEAAELTRKIGDYETELSRAALSGGDSGMIMAEVTSLRRMLGVRDTNAPDELTRALAPMRYLGNNTAEIAMAVSQRASQIVSTLSNGRLTQITVDIDGTVHVTTGGNRGNAAGLQALPKALVVLALRAAILLGLPSAARLPVFVHPVTLPIDGADAIMRVFASVLAQGGFQVVQLVRAPAHAQGVPHVVKAA